MSAEKRITNRALGAMKPGDKAHIEHRVSVGDMRSFTTFAAAVSAQAVDRALAPAPV